MRLHAFTVFSVLAFASFASGCSGSTGDDAPAAEAVDELRGPGAGATDRRGPELGPDLKVLRASKISLAEGVAQAEAENGPVIEAKFELNDDKQLSLSIYPAGKSLAFDAERNVFQELSGDPSAAPFAGSLDSFQDQEHLTRSSRDLTLVQLSRLSLAEAIERVSYNGDAFWAIPTLRHGRAGYGVYTARGKQQRWYFVDGGGSRSVTKFYPKDLGDGPGSLATDARVPELGPNLSVLNCSKISMSDALEQAEEAYGALIEAKFELGDDGKLSLSIYPVGKGLDVDAERNTFFEAAGDPTAGVFRPALSEFKVPDVEHLTRSARDLTIVQAAGLSLREAVSAAEHALPGGFVFWAIPTIRDTRAGYGVYVYGTDKKAHYFFIS